jgi:uncharacterized membrane protein
MKQTIWILSLLVIAGLFLMQGSVVVRNISQNSDVSGDFVYPEDVKNVIDQKCYGCHSVKGKSDKAKDALMWDSVPNLSAAKQISVLNDIIDVLEDGSMPPEEMVKKFPEAKLTDEERDLMHTWAEAKADSLFQ